MDDARTRLTTALDLIDQDLAAKTWAMGDDFTMADCSAAPALYYANLVMPFADSHKNVTRYFERLLARPSFARAVKKADPYRKLFPRLERDYLSLNREIAASFLHLSHRERSARFGAPGEEL